MLDEAGAYQTKFNKKLSKVVSLACKTHKMKEKRNTIVHEIATKWAKLNKELIKDQRDFFDREKNKWIQRRRFFRIRKSFL